MKSNPEGKPTEPLLMTVGGLKGGTGRSTTAVFLALSIHQATGEPVLLVDADDKNGTAYEWSEDAGESWPTGVSTLYWPSMNLAKRIKDLDPSGHIVIDTGNNAAILRQALRVTGNLIIPLAPTGTESTRLTPTLEAAAEVTEDRPVTLSVLLSRTVPRTNSRTQARTALTEAGITVLDTEIPRREMYSQAFGTVPNDLGAFPEALTEITERNRA
ncbi:ParA family protein [Acaricomes phytoseiuli]|uniref:nucleotide-binding protein n=1 Tax=Acaricomes phytoseiuli TaxID=291968 RepID=UPI0003A4FA10|nr:ParA family protein [Acaricomes phytoseiuli]